jgi:hypothetical protein
MISMDIGNEDIYQDLCEDLEQLWQQQEKSNST